MKGGADRGAVGVLGLLLITAALLTGCASREAMVVSVSDAATGEAVAGARVTVDPLYVLHLAGPAPEGGLGITDHHGELLLSLPRRYSLAVEVCPPRGIWQDVTVRNPSTKGRPIASLARTSDGQPGTVRVAIRYAH